MFKPIIIDVEWIELVFLLKKMVVIERYTKSIETILFEEFCICLCEKVGEKLRLDSAEKKLPNQRMPRTWPFPEA